MALTIGLNDLISVRLNFSDANDDDGAYNMLYYRVNNIAGAPPAQSQMLAAIALEMYTKWSTLWAPAAGPDVKFNGCTVCDVFPLPRSVSVTYTDGTPTTGAGTGDAIPLQDAPTLLKTTEVGNRWGMGRLFYVGLSEDFQDGGRVVGGAVASLGTMAAALDDAVVVNSGGCTVTLGPVLKRGPEDNPVSLTPITGGRLSDTIIKSQRRRRVGKGI